MESIVMVWLIYTFFFCCNPFSKPLQCGSHHWRQIQENCIALCAEILGNNFPFRVENFTYHWNLPTSRWSCMCWDKQFWNDSNIDLQNPHHGLSTLDEHTIRGTTAIPNACQITFEWSSNRSSTIEINIVALAMSKSLCFCYAYFSLKILPADLLTSTAMPNKTLSNKALPPFTKTEVETLTTFEASLMWLSSTS